MKTSTMLTGEPIATYADYDREAARRDREAIDSAARSVRFSRVVGPAYDAVRLDCFNKREADDLLAYARARYPDITWGATWVAGEKMREEQGDD